MLAEQDGTDLDNSKGQSEKENNNDNNNKKKS